MATTSLALKEYWKDDFFPLAAAGKAILRELREDEAGGDLHRRILGSGSGSHLYFSSESAFQHERSIPLPPSLANQTRVVSKSLLMGLLPEASLAWMSVDHKLYLWFMDEEDDFVDLEIASKQSIVCVGITKPKKGVFKELIEWCLVISTLDEVILCALVLQDGRIHVVPTRYTLPADDIPIISICGVSGGRIFMGGYDGSLYEFDYESLISKDPQTPRTKEQLLNDYYNGTAESIQLKDSRLTNPLLSRGKRAFASLTGAPERARKCRKLNHSVKGFAAIASVIVPDWLRKAPEALFGASNSGPLEKIVHDTERQCLYTLSARGFISLYGIRDKDLSLQASLDCGSVSRQYLSAIAKGHMFPPSPSIEFVGGVASAQAGVGGMDGARSILKFAETDIKGNILTPISIHVLPQSDSKMLTLLAITSGGLRYYLTTGQPSMDSANLVPASKLIMSHIRAPPPVDPTTGRVNPTFEDREVPGGMIPCLLHQFVVDSASYSDGHLFLALQRPHQSVQSRDLEVGNTIVGANPDFSSHQVTGTESKIQREMLGGVTETVSFPAAILPGGRIMGSSVIGFSRSTPLMRLVLHSQTPSDSELSVGLVPPFFPKVEAKIDDDRIIDPTITATSLQGAHTTSNVKSPFSKPPKSGIALQVLSNFLLSRPLGHGIVFRKALPNSMAINLNNQYRISTRFGSEGFSHSAEESGTKDTIPEVSTKLKSTRLSRWLLRPALVPLNEMSIAHLLPSPRTVAISIGGVHFFKSNTILTNLADILMKAGPNVAHDALVISFCNNYGPKQFCTFAFMLAIGCGPAAGVGNAMEELRSRAYKAAFGSGGEPRLTRSSVNSEVRDAFVVQDSSTDPLVPAGYEFKPSFLSDAMVSLTSRLLRPIWFKPAVVVTEGQEFQKISTSAFSHPAKVEILLDGTSWDLIRTPLFTLVQLMQHLFRRAVQGVPGVGVVDNNRMDFDESSVLTGSMRFQGALRLRGNVADALTVEDEIGIARLIEESNLHSLYRLISRSVQLLDLLSLLQRAQSMHDLPEVQWGLLHGLTISQLVESREAHERVETLLNSLVSHTKVIDEVNVAPAADSDLLAKSLTSQCFLYFSPGAGLSYLGFRAANEALTCAQQSSRRATLSKQAVVNFKKAAVFWTNAQLVTGRFLHSGEAESYEQKVKLALQYDSPLARAASALLKIGEYIAIVDLCIIAANNFRADTSAMVFSTVQSGGFPWEKSLYHSSINDDNFSNGTSRPTSASVVGSSVTAKDAISTCHAIILYHLLVVLNSLVHDDLKNSMVSACAACPDKDFQKELFEFLVRSKKESLLVKIDSADVESWLDGTNDPHLKWRYYISQRKFPEAGELMWNLATDVKQKISLDDKILFLERSQSAFTSALAAMPSQSKTREYLQLEMNRIRSGEHLDIARLQQRALKALESRGADADLLKEKIDVLKSRLIDVSSLYNDYAAECELHDVCLHILRSCRHDDHDTVEQLWRKVIVQHIFPCATRSVASYNFLSSLRCTCADNVELLSLDSQETLNPLFETGFWVDRVRSDVVALGKELHGKDYEFIIPVEFLVMTLEGLRHALQSTPSFPWPLQMMLTIGVSFPNLLDSYEALVEREMTALIGLPDPRRQFWSLKSIVELLEEWVNVALNGAAENRAYRELSESIISQHLMSRIDQFKAGLEALSRSGGAEETRRVLNRLGQIEEVVRKY